MNLTLYYHWLEILDYLNIGAFLIDSDRRVKHINDSARLLVGLEKKEIEGEDCQEVFCGIPCFSNCPFHDKKDHGVRDMDIEFTDEFHEKHRVTRVGAPLIDSFGNVQGCVTVLQDHSPYPELVNRIHYEEQSLKIILDSLNLGIFTVNRNGLVTFFNQAAEKISGFTRIKLLGKDCRMLFGSNFEKDRTLLGKALKSGETMTGIKAVLTSFQGERVPISSDYIPLLNTRGDIIGALAAFQDMTLVNQLKKAITGKYKFHHMISKDPVMFKIFDMVKVVAQTESTVLIEGATGTGKDLLAKIVHTESNRSGKPFVKVNCAAIPESLIESEFFGYVKGAFTGAGSNKPGRFCEADTGTIFLDEIGDLPLPLQAKLLRVLEDREFYPLGSRHTKKVDIRIISATNRRLESLVEKKLFREDLFYRLNVLRIELPLLCERQGDLPLLIRHFLRKHAGIMKKNPPDICEEAMKVLLDYHYPGNVRELENIIEHSMIICQGDSVHRVHLPTYIQNRFTMNNHARKEHSVGARNGMRSNAEQRIIDCLEKFNWNRGRAAASLQMDRTTLWRKMKKYGIARTKKPQ